MPNMQEGLRTRRGEQQHQKTLGYYAKEGHCGKHERSSQEERQRNRNNEKTKITEKRERNTSL